MVESLSFGLYSDIDMRAFLFLKQSLNMSSKIMICILLKDVQLVSVSCFWLHLNSIWVSCRFRIDSDIIWFKPFLTTMTFQSVVNYNTLSQLFLQYFTLFDSILFVSPHLGSPAGCTIKMTESNTVQYTYLNGRWSDESTYFNVLFE